MKYDIFFHNDFDGRASAAVMLAFLQSRGDDIANYVPIKYDIIPEWVDERYFEKRMVPRRSAAVRGRSSAAPHPAIIVDFPYHPASAFWFDHHLKPFRRDGWEARFKPDREHRYDDTYRSACHLVYDSLRQGFGWKPPVHMRELVRWLDVVDGADYRSARQTIELKEPALLANAAIEFELNNHAAAEWTVRYLADHSLEQYVSSSRIRPVLARVRRAIASGVAFYRGHIVIDGRVMIADLSPDPAADIAHFAPYYIHPDMLYVVRYHPFYGKPNLFHINVGCNPWRRSENKKHIGELMKRFGGGGHRTVGGAEIEGRTNTLRAVADMVDYLNRK